VEGESHQHVVHVVCALHETGFFYKIMKYFVMPA